MDGEPVARQQSFPLPRLLAPDVQRAAQLPQQRRVFGDKRKRVQRANESARRQRMNNIEWRYFEMREPLMRSRLHQPKLADSDLALSMTSPFPDGRHHALQKYLRIPEVRFKEQNLAARLEQTV